MRETQQLLDALMEGRRASYAFQTKTAARSLGISDTKLGDWADRTDKKIQQIGVDQPVEMLTQMLIWSLRIVAAIEEQRQRPTHRA